MKTNKARKLLLATLIIGVSFKILALNISDIFGPKEFGAAYRTKKTVAFLSSVTIVGKNNALSLEVKKDSTGKIYFEAIVPIVSFNSGNQTRDEHVAEILKSTTSPNIVYHSSSHSLSEWKEKFIAPSFNETGFLLIGSTQHPISFVVSVTPMSETFVLSGMYKGTFAEFGIKPPVVGPLGVIANAVDWLELYFKIDGTNMKTQFDELVKQQYRASCILPKQPPLFKVY